MVHVCSLPPHQGPEAALPRAWMLLSQALHRGLQLGILERPWRGIPQP
jgi:hypothetical protein